MAGLGLDFAGALFSGGDIGSSLIQNISGGDPSKIFGSKPDVAQFKEVNLADETAKAVKGTLENLPDISKLLDSITGGNFSDLVSTGTANALALTQGKLPQSDADALMRSGAFKGLQFQGSPAGRALQLRDLGIGDLQGQEAGANMAQQWTNLAEAAYSPFTISTGQQAGTTAANNAGIQAMKQFQFNVAAAPTPSYAGQFALDQHIGDQFMSFGLGAAGGAIAGAGGGVGALPSGAQGNSLGGGYAAAPNYGYSPFNVTGAAPNYAVNPTWGGAAPQYYGVPGGV